MKETEGVAPPLAAPQQKPRPLPLFLDMVQRETRGDPARLAAALAGLRRYQDAPRPERPPPPPAIAELNGARLLDYGGSGPKVLFVPSLINPPHVLDLKLDRSLLRWLAGQGLRPLLLDWGSVHGRADLDVAGHVEQILLPMIEGLGAPPLLAGYCLGGTMALAAAAKAPVLGLALIAAPWRFSAFADSRASLLSLWREQQPLARSLGLLPMEVLQSAFWSLDPARTVAKYERLAGATPDALDAFVLLEDWANDGPPLPLPAAAEVFDYFFDGDAPSQGRWIAQAEQVRVPVLNIVSRTDRIVPEASAAPIGQRLDLDLGHVGMIVGARAQAEVWEPLAGWLSQVGATC